MLQFDNTRVPDCPHGAARSECAKAARPRREVRLAVLHAHVPLVVDCGSGVVIRDVDGNLFLDFTAGIAVCTTGHCHPEVVAAIRDQAGKLIHMSGTDFYYTPQIDLAEVLAGLAPGSSPKKVFFCNSGAEAVEAGLKLVAASHASASRGRVLSERSTAAPTAPCPCRRRSCSTGAVFRRSCRTFITCISRGVGERRECEEIEELFHRTAPPDEVAAIFIEPVQGEGGYHPAPLQFLRGLRSLCDQAWHSARRRRSAERHGTNRQDVRDRACRRRAGHHLPGQGRLRAGCRSGRSSRNRRSWIGRPAATPAPSAATPSPVERP